MTLGTFAGNFTALGAGIMCLHITAESVSQFPADLVGQEFAAGDNDVRPDVQLVIIGKQRQI